MYYSCMESKTTIKVELDKQDLGCVGAGIRAR